MRQSKSNFPVGKAMISLFHDTLQCLKNVIKVSEVAGKYSQLSFQLQHLMRMWRQMKLVA